MGVLSPLFLLSRASGGHEGKVWKRLRGKENEEAAPMGRDEKVRRTPAPHLSVEEMHFASLFVWEELCW